MREPTNIPLASQPHKKYRPGGRRNRNDLRDQCSERHGLVLHIYLCFYFQMYSHIADPKDTPHL